MTDTPTHFEDDQQRISELLRSFDAPAPESLHVRVESLVAARRDRGFAGRFRGRWLPSLRVAGAGAIAAAIVALVVVLGVGAGGTQTLSVGQVAAPTLSGATLPAPPESPTHHAQLLASVDSVSFPYWGERFGWHSTGARIDQVAGHTVTTVFYANSHGEQVGYAIFAGTPAPRTGGAVAWRGHVSYRVLAEDGTIVVTWLRDGHLCVVSGHGVSSATLLRLASWGDRATSS